MSELSDFVQHVVRLTGYGYGLLVSVFAVKFWGKEYRRPAGLTMSLFMGMTYLAGLLYSIDRIVTGANRAPLIVVFFVLTAIGYIQPTMILYAIRGDMKKEAQRRRALELAHQISMDTQELLQGKLPEREREEP